MHPRVRRFVWMTVIEEERENVKMVNGRDVEVGERDDRDG